MRSLIVVLLTSVAMLPGCEPSPPRATVTQTTPTTATRQAPSSKTSAMPLLLGSVPPFALQTERRRAISNNTLIGKVWVVTFLFTRSTTYPAQTAALTKLQEELRQGPIWEHVRLISISVDPEHDTPELLSEYAQKAGADPDHWTFVTGDRAKTWTLSTDGFKLPVSAAQDNSGGSIAHSPTFALVDRGGRIRAYYDDLNTETRGQLKRDIERILDDPPWPFLESKTVTDDNPPGQVVYQPLELKDTPWLKERAEAQLATRPHFDVFYDFEFTDHLPQSGITFMNQVVEDAGKNFKAVHYDHGTGVAVADIDGDDLLDVYWVTQLGENHLYKNLGKGKFENITAKAKVGLGDRIGVTASFADIDNDSDPDLFVTTVKTGNALFENLGEGLFRDITSDAGLSYGGHSSGAVFFDYDRDGLLDLFVCNVGEYTTDERGPGNYFIGHRDGFSGHTKPERQERSLFYKNLGKRRFREISTELDLNDVSWTGDASPLDFNEDGWPDLYVLSMQGHDQYYENVEGKRFVKKSREIFPRTPWGSMGIKVFDFDNDGLLDIYITDMHTDMIDDLRFKTRLWRGEKLKMHETYSSRFLNTDLNHVLGNAFFHNQGNGQFQEASDPLGAETYWPWGLSVGDLNADGFEDVFVTGSMNYPYRYAVNSVLLNNRGKKFLDSEFILGVEPRRDGRTAKPWFELNCDNPADNNPVASKHCKDRSGTLTIWGALGTRSSAVFDIDNDGDLDIVTNDFNSEPMVLLSNLSDKTKIHYLKVQLVGTKSNRDGLGAKVRVQVGQETYTKVQDGVSGYLSHSVMPLYFGLGSATQADAIEVLWPSGRKQRLAGPVKLNQLLKITEDA